jgi:hypothetical protein
MRRFGGCCFLLIFSDSLKENKSKEGVLKIRENPNTGFYIDKLSIFSVKNEEDLMKKLKQGNKGRKVRATNMNEYSSRSHTIFTIGIVICNISNGSG